MVKQIIEFNNSNIVHKYILKPLLTTSKNTIICRHCNIVLKFKDEDIMYRRLSENGHPVKIPCIICSACSCTNNIDRRYKYNGSNM